MKMTKNERTTNDEMLCAMFYGPRQKKYATIKSA